MIIETTGNLLRDDAQALVNPVNTVGVMGKGLALQFKRAFPANFDAYAVACKEGRVEPGRVLAVPGEGGHWILNFPTKRHWRENSRLEDIREGLDDLARLAQELKLNSMAVPPLGCGNGGLPWNVVRGLIHEKLAGLTAQVRLYTPGTPAPADMPNRTAAPEMTRKTARLLVALSRYIQTTLDIGVAVQSKTSLLEFHKIVYLLQGAGLDLGFRFEASHYGPFSAQLNRLVSGLEGHYVTGYGDGTGGARADLGLLPAAKSAETLTLEDTAFDRAWEEIARACVGYEYPEGMELLASVHFLATHTDKPVEPRQLAQGIADWSPRKRRLFRADDVTSAWGQLKQTALL